LRDVSQTMLARIKSARHTVKVPVSGVNMLRGVLYYLVVWLVVSAAIYGYNSLNRREKMTVIRSVLYGLVTATIALGIVLLIVYLF
jgi:hypothetical protein